MTILENHIKKYAYDIEVFPNFFSATFLDCDSKKEFSFTIYKEIDDRQKLIEFLDRDIQIIGFNNISYDGPILYYIISNKKKKNIVSDLFNISTRLISDEHRNDEDLRKIRFPRDVKWSQMDLMKIMAFDMLGVSLKQIAINLKWRRIQDLPLPYDHMVESDEVKLILDYNLNDVLITYQLYTAIQPQISLRSQLGELFGVNLTSASDSKMANIILEKIYVEEAHIDINSLKNLRTKRSQVRIGDCLGEHIEFQTKELNHLKEELENIIVTAESKYAYRKTIAFGGGEYELGIGGLHSKDGPGKFFATNDQFIRDADVASYYPSMIINNHIKPEHLGDDFIRILQKITRERLEAKRSGDKVKADGLKITINSIFGKLGSDTFWLEDAKAMLAVTVSGQLYLLMLIEALTLAGITVISANTDGIVSQIPKELEDKFKEICDWWQAKTSFELEFTDYILYVRSDVNNYITKKADGKTKEKGRYMKEIDLKKGYRHPIVPRCLYEYFINGKPVEQTLSECTDILDFCISQKTGKDFKLEYRTVNETTGLQKTNRFFISNSGGVLIKRNMVSNTEAGLFIGNLTKILNDFDEKIPFSEYDVNLDFYKKEALKYIEEIEPSIVQVSMFDMFSDFQTESKSKLTLRDKSNKAESPNKASKPELSEEFKLESSQAIVEKYHPLKQYEHIFSELSITASPLIKTIADKNPIRVAGLVTVVRPYVTKQGKPMGFATIEDIQGIIELVLFPKTWTQFQPVLEVGKVILVEGKVDAQAAPPKILVDAIKTEFKYLVSADAAAQEPSAPVGLKPRSEEESPRRPNAAPTPAPAPAKVVPPAPKPTPPAPKAAAPVPAKKIAEPAPAYATPPHSDWDDDMPPPPDNFPAGWEMEWQPSFEAAEIAARPEPKRSPSTAAITPPRIEARPEVEVEPEDAVTEPAPGPAPVKEGPKLAVAPVDAAPIPTSAPRVPPVPAPPTQKEESDHAPQQITITLRPTGDKDLDRRRIKVVYGTLISFHGKDRFSLQIFEGGKGHLIDFPSDSTRICSDLLNRLKIVLGEETWSIEPIVFQ